MPKFHDEDESDRLRRVERELQRLGSFLRHAPPFAFSMHKGHYPPDFHTMIDDFHSINSRDQHMSQPKRLPAPIVADTADEYIAKTAEAEAKEKREASIRMLASVVKSADAMRERARAKLVQAKAARKAVKKVRNDPDASIEDIEAAIAEALKNGAEAERR